VESPTLAEFVEVYLAQHEGEPETTEKLRTQVALLVGCSGWVVGMVATAIAARGAGAGWPAVV